MGLSNEITPVAPFHVLMSPSPLGSPQKRRLDPRLEQDYLAKRHKAFSRDGEDVAKPNNNNPKEGGYSVWAGATKLERDLIACCESPEDEDAIKDPTELGTLDRSKEIRFVGLLVRECHTKASRSLALAILERTLETYLNEKEESEDEEEARLKEDEIGGVASDDENDADYKPGSAKRRTSKRKQKMTEKEKEKEEAEEMDRFECFLGAGGLRIINRWLQEGTQSITVPVPKAPPGSNSKPPASITKPSPLRPMVLPILSLLEHLPFDKKLVVESKINKEIRNLDKQIDGILDARAKGKHRKEDLENWTAETKGTHALDEVREATDSLKLTWGDLARTRRDKIPDFFDSLKNKMRYVNKTKTPSRSSNGCDRF
jgi:hypothetical protein